MNASMCCITEGCNCAGTQLSESMARLPFVPIVLGVFILGFIIFIIYYIWDCILHPAGGKGK